MLDGPAEELQQGCCSYGAHLIDDDDVQIVVRAFVRVKPEQMQFHAKAVRGGFMRPGEPDSEGQPTTITRLVDDACIFLNRPGFAGGVGCALHIAALEAGERPLDWKPNVCWQVPIRLEHHTDDNGHVTSPPARVEAPRLGRRRQRLPLVVHRVAGGLRRSGTRLQVEPRRDPRARRSPHLRPHGGAARAPQVDPAPPPRRPPLTIPVRPHLRAGPVRLLVLSELRAPTSAR